LNVLNNIKY